MKKVLIVDDIAAVRKSVALSLKSKGYEVDEAEDGNKAIALMDGHQYHLIITDILMPNMDGTEVVMLARQKQPNAKIIAMSGGGVDVPVDTALMIAKTQADAVLKKPFNNQQLEEAISGIA